MSDYLQRAVNAYWDARYAIATEAAAAAETTKIGSVHEGAGRQASPERPNSSQTG